MVGPNYFNFQTIIDEFVQADAVAWPQVTLIGWQLIKFVFEPEMAEQMNARAQEIMQKNTGT